MSGIFLLAVVGLWVWLVFKASKWIGAKVNASRWRPPVIGLVFAVLLLLPVTDEIVGGFQFRALCEQNASQFRLGVVNPEGRTTKYSAPILKKHLNGTMIPISHSRKEFHDTTTQELVVAVESYSAKGGLFIRTLGISNNSSPLTIGSPTCSPESKEGEVVSRTLKFNVIN